MTKRNGSVGSFRPAHGAAAKGGKTVVFEAVADGMRPAEPSSTAAQAPIVGKPFDTETARSAAAMSWALDKLPNFDPTLKEFGCFGNTT